MTISEAFEKARKENLKITHDSLVNTKYLYAGPYGNLFDNKGIFQRGFFIGKMFDPIWKNNWKIYKEK